MDRSRGFCGKDSDGWEAHATETWFTVAYLVLLTLGLTVEAWPRGSTRVQQLSGAQEWEKANFFSRSSQYYSQPIISLAAKQHMLYPSDVANLLPKEYSTETGYARLSVIWNRKMSRYYDKVHAAGGPANPEAVKKVKKPSLMLAILEAHRRGILPVITAKFASTFLDYLSPALLGYFLDYIQGTSDDDPNLIATGAASPLNPGQGEKPIGYGVLLAFSIFFARSLVSVIYSDYHRRIFLHGAEAKATLTSMIYRKALILSPDARRKSSTGAILNHMSVDALQWEEGFDYLALWVSIPFDFAICFYMLFQLLGWSFLAGVGTILAFMPFQTWRAKVFEGLEEERLKTTDERVRVTTEILSSIKIVKLYGWEAAFKSKILDARKAELNVLSKMGALEAVMSLVFASTSTIVTFVTFATYVTIGNGVLTPKIVFVSLTLFDLLHDPVSRLAEGTATTIALIVATKRIQRFLMREEIDNTQIIREKYDENSETPAVELNNATFTWTSGETSGWMDDAEEDDDEESEDENDNGPKDQQPLLSAQEGSTAETDEVNAESALPPKSTLRNITLSVKNKTITAIVGRVGQGKSSLLNAMIGEMYKLDGTIRVRGRVAYVPQQAFITNATVRDNIIFGCLYDPDRYRRVLTACGLDPDLDSLPAGDMTEIGERGINLSGGQKQRVSLARATYSDADIYLLDDPLSAVDAHVDRHLWDNLIGPEGILKNKTRILVTHGINHLDHVDQVVVIKDGEISEVGRYEDLVAAKNAFYQLMKEYSAKHSKRRRSSHVHVDSSALESATAAAMTDSASGTDLDSDIETIEDEGVTETPAKADAEGYDDEEEDQLIAEEIMKKGGVELRLAKAYAKACGAKYAVLVVVLIILGEASTVATNFWLKYWMDRTREELAESIYLFLAGLLLFAVLYIVVHMVYIYLAFAVARIRASEQIHRNLATVILRLPMSFYDTTPLGRILNRFSGDLYSIDEHLPWKFLDLGYLTTAVLSTLLVVLFSTPAFIFVVPFIAAGFYIIQDYYLWATRSLKRFDSVSISPIYQHFDETLNGVSTIRAMSVQQRFIDENAKRTNFNANAYTGYSYGNRWVDLRLQWLSASVILSIALFGVLERDTIDVGVLGLSMSFAMGITDCVMWLCRDFSEWQSHLIAIERVQEYTDKHTEAPETSSKVVPALWPAQGQVIFRNYSTRYREGLDLVLKHLSFEIKPQEKIGIVGRTGAGKSSLTLALFRIIEAANSPWAIASDNSGYHDKKGDENEDEERDDAGEHEPLLGGRNSNRTYGQDENNTGDNFGRVAKEDESIDGGSIEIDGIDISTLGLTDLRKHLAIIPQDPTLFAGTIRDNLDPFQELVDADLWEALERAHLKDFVSTLSGGLHAKVAQNGENFSIGQRSLICLARALLRKSKILILDEATAAVDVETDELIQRTIREEFKDRTVLTIAHRIKTVMDSDRILVMEQGKVVEFESPRVLLQREESLFFRLAHQAGEVAGPLVQTL
ncbi:Multidrug resistance-associated protein 1 [Linnemannia zychae]|nr:Multidrug resistance-associated protein 1 [Linnemannia zychae]